MKWCTVQKMNASDLRYPGEIMHRNEGESWFLFLGSHLIIRRLLRLNSPYRISQTRPSWTKTLDNRSLPFLKKNNKIAMRIAEFFRDSPPRRKTGRTGEIALARDCLSRWSLSVNETFCIDFIKPDLTRVRRTWSEDGRDRTRIAWPLRLGADLRKTCGDLEKP